jgi:VanZ family protein
MHRQASMQQPHRSSATLFALLFAALIAYASLYPFSEWRDQGVGPFEFITAPWPRYWSQFDTVANFFGYAPLGFLTTLALLRTTLVPRPIVWATLAACALSLCMEAMQTYLPQRVPAMSDWLLNTGGALAGAWLASAMEQLGAIDHWSRFRSRWFARDARASIVLLATWPVALLFPPAVPLGLGQVFERLETAMENTFANTPFLQWLPVRSLELQPMAPVSEVVCVALGLLAPCLLGYAMIPDWQRRTRLLIVVCAVSLLASSLSAALSYGPEAAWAWMKLPVWIGLACGISGALLCLALQERACLAWLLVALVWQLSLVNLVPSTPYFAQTLQGWEQGRFIRFNGLAQWLGWIWPYMALGVAIQKLSQRIDAYR